MGKAILILSFLLFSVGMHAQIDSNEIIAKPEKVKVFPNPASNILNILGLQNSDNATILISDIYGNTVLQHQWQIKNRALNIPVAALSKGIYMISIQSEEQTIQTKFYKQ
ncbi:T9SS type A sorting domain-containing protein [Maribacter sp. 2210JD10-5]|uniref:T9SS type A sorting domain-containing protein n=1 Tax=Maribacter sp. 2210JD10-5 TaxID=3386272 RepID=UPI0039BC9B25